MKAVLITKTDKQGTRMKWRLAILNYGKQVYSEYFGGDAGQAAAKAMQHAGMDSHGGNHYSQIVAPKEVMKIVEKSGYADGVFNPEIVTVAKAKAALQKALSDSWAGGSGRDANLLSDRIKTIVSMM